MVLLTRTFWRWLPLAFLTTALCTLVYLAVQQVGRQFADEPQVQMARDAAAALAAGRPVESVVPAVPVDFGQSLAPFVMVLDEAGAVVASSGRLGGQARVVALGVLEHVRQSGEERVTWQPEPGVRVATVVVRRIDKGAGFVVSGRALRETEERTLRIQAMVGLAWIATLVGLFVLVGAGEYLTARPEYHGRT